MTQNRAFVGALAAFLSIGAFSARPCEAGSAVVQVVVPGSVSGRVVDMDAVRAWRTWLADQGFDLDRCGFDSASGTMTVDIASDHQRELLVNAGFTILEEWPAVSFEPVFLTDSQYFDPADIEAILNQAVADHPDITHISTIGITYEGRPILAIEISDNPGVDEDEPAIQFNAAHHAREVATQHVVVDVIETLTDGYGSDPDVTAWVDSYKTVCVPMVNPDGVQFVFDGSSSWRKNRQFYPPTCIGVDLNRNYPYLWGPDACGSPSASCTLTYYGPSAASELETQAMMDLADAYHFVMATSYHSFGRFIDYPYACYDWEPGAGPMPEHVVIAEMMDAMAAAISSVGGDGTYASYSDGSIGPLSGDDTSWYYAHLGTYAFIVEIGGAFEPSFSAVAGIVASNRAGWEYLYERLGGARIDVHVTDACSGAPIEAEVTLTDYVFDTGELPRETFLPFGRWTFVVPPNDAYTVRASKPGYITQNVPVSVGTAPESVDIELVPSSSTVFGDSDCDGDIDLVDYSGFETCLLGPGGGVAQLCKPFDFEPDNDVDLKDFREFQIVFSP